MESRSSFGISVASVFSPERRSLAVVYVFLKEGHAASSDWEKDNSEITLFSSCHR